MEHREVKTPEQIAELKARSPGGYRNLRESVINELPEENLLRTPSVTDSTGGAISETQARERNRMVKVADQVAELAFENNLKVSPSIAASLLPTPAVAHVRNHDEPVENYLQRRQDFIDGKTKGMPGASLGVAVRMEMLPTVTVQDGKNTAGKSQFERNTLPLNAEVTLLPTVQVDDAKNTGHNQERRTTLASEVWLAETTTNWGKFTAAIERWESLTRVAPSPTKPDGKDGNHRLSAEFTEWMMGLPEGWVTAEDIGLKRNDQLKACGNGVVPQQAELALRILLQDIQIEFRGGR
jgi:DNA (cytosine-5)-methyltransferase 1